MILYLDTSALVKRYFKESYSDEVIARWADASDIITSSVAYAETMASFYRKKREAGLKQILLMKTVDSFHKEWQSLIRVDVTDELNEYIDKAVENNPLKGFDAVHLASAMMIQERLDEKLLFMCFDEKLLYAAQKEGIKTFPVI